MGSRKKKSRRKKSRKYSDSDSNSSSESDSLSEDGYEEFNSDVNNATKEDKQLIEIKKKIRENKLFKYERKIIQELGINSLDKAKKMKDKDLSSVGIGSEGRKKILKLFKKRRSYSSDEDFSDSEEEEESDYEYREKKKRKSKKKKRKKKRDKYDF